LISNCQRDQTHHFGGNLQPGGEGPDRAFRQSLRRGRHPGNGVRDESLSAVRRGDYGGPSSDSFLRRLAERFERSHVPVSGDESCPIDFLDDGQSASAESSGRTLCLFQFWIL